MLHFGKPVLAAFFCCLALVACKAGNAGTFTPGTSENTLGNAFDFRASGQGAYYGCHVFPGIYYSNSIASAKIDSNSTKYIQSAMQAGNTGNFAPSTGIESINLANNATPLLVVHPKVQYHHFPVDYPWKSSFLIERESDHHAMVVQTQKCHVYESYDTTYDGKLSAFSGANWNLQTQFVPLAPGTPSSMASGLPNFAGIVRWEDFESGSIDHALNWDAPEGTVAQYQFVRPASDTDGLRFRGSSHYQMPYGARLRLKNSVDTSGWGPQARMVATALRVHGMYLSDTDTTGNMLYFANKSDGSNPWNIDDLASLGKLHLSDFDVVVLPPIQHTPGH